MCAYVDVVAHINVTPEISVKISQEEVEAHTLGVIMVQEFSLPTGIKKIGDKSTKSISK